MSAGEVFQQFYVELVTALPMNDSLFLANLFTRGLLPGDLKQQIRVEKTLTDKATCFLDHKISHDVSIGNSTSFYQLLNVMEDSGNKTLKMLAGAALKKGPSSTAGYCNVQFVNAAS